MTTLGELILVHHNMKDADFWLTKDGKPTNKPDWIGIKVLDTDVLLPKYLYYWMQYLEAQGYWKKYPLTVDEISSIVVSFSD